MKTKDKEKVLWKLILFYRLVFMMELVSKETEDQLEESSTGISFS